MEKPKKPRKETAIEAAVRLGDFTREEFINMFKDIELEHKSSGVSFPLGTVKGDVDELLFYLEEVEIITKTPYGLYSCKTE